MTEIPPTPEARRVAKKAVALALCEDIKHAGSHLRLAFEKAKIGAHTEMSMSAADCIVRLVEACDKADQSVMPLVFERLKQNDRMQP